jgi:hypothetical protein
LQVTGSTDCTLELKAGSDFSVLAQNGTTLQIRNNATAGAMTFSTVSTERMRITDAGNVGIGTSSPTARLNIVSSGQQMAVEPSLGNADASVMVGRGLTLSGTAAIVGTKSFINCAFEGSDDSAYSPFGYVTTAVGTRGQIATAFYIETKSAGSSTPAERMRIDSAGNVGIGTSSPTSKLDVNGVIADSNGNVRKVPQSGSSKTSSYTLATTDVGEYILLGASGAIVIPDATFAAGDIVTIFNNTASTATITCSITTAYIAGTFTDKATMTLAAAGVATVLFITSTLCVVSGNVT